MQGDYQPRQSLTEQCFACLHSEVRSFLFEPAFLRVGAEHQGVEAVVGFDGVVKRFEGEF